MKSKKPNIFVLHEPPLQTEPMPAKQRPKKLYAALATVLVIVIVVAALIFVPQGNADVISLGVHYRVGEKLTYDITTSISTQLNESSSSYAQDSTAIIEVMSFDGDTYRLNYTTITSMLGYHSSTSRIVNVKESEMVTALALLPVEIQGLLSLGASTANLNETGLLTGFFNQSQAKVGDTWTIPLGTTGSSLVNGEITVTFRAIQDLTVTAGTYKVFRMDLSSQTTPQGVPSSYGLSYDVSGQAYLESGTCRQIKSELTLNMGTDSSLSSLGSYSMAYTFTSTLTDDSQP
jgi:hypothetical protein